MRARLRQFYENLNESFWLRPALIVLCAMALAQFFINAERSELLPLGLLSDWVYSGGETGARTLLGAIAGSTIGVAGTVFSITIATLTLASSQMGPRLLRNFTRDRGNQATLGIYLGTFAYALIVLRSVRGAEQVAFVPHLAITGAIVLAMLCVAMLIFFVNHVASRINFDTVIELVYLDLRHSVEHLAADAETHAPLPETAWEHGLTVVHEGSGYIQQLDEDQIADWAHEHGVVVRLHARTGDFVFPGAPLAVVAPGIADAGKVICNALVLGAYPTATSNLEYTVEQLVDIAVRALSSGVNDPRTANRILDRLGAALCVVAAKPLPTGVLLRNDKVVFQRNATTYDGLTDAMFHDIRQCAKGSATVLIHMADVLIKISQCEHDAMRRRSIRRHGDLLLADARRTIENSSDSECLEKRVAALFAIFGAN